MDKQTPEERRKEALKGLEDTSLAKAPMVDPEFNRAAQGIPPLSAAQPSKMVAQQGMHLRLDPPTKNRQRYNQQMRQDDKAAKAANAKLIAQNEAIRKRRQKQADRGKMKDDHGKD